MLLGTGPAADLKPYTGKSAVGRAVIVQSVPADEGFWVGSSSTQRIWVQLSGAKGESTYTVKPGDKIDFTGVVKPADAGFADKVGVTASEGGAKLTSQGQYVSVNKEAVKLVR